MHALISARKMAHGGRKRGLSPGLSRKYDGYHTKKAVYTRADRFHHDALTSRRNDMNCLLPTTPKLILDTRKPTHGKGGRVIQPGGGFAGN